MSCVFVMSRVWFLSRSEGGFSVSSWKQRVGFLCSSGSRWDLFRLVSHKPSVSHWLCFIWDWRRLGSAADHDTFTLFLHHERINAFCALKYLNDLLYPTAVSHNAMHLTFLFLCDKYHNLCLDSIKYKINVFYSCNAVLLLWYLLIFVIIWYFQFQFLFRV